MYQVSKTYSIVTPESAEQGDYAETGFMFEPKEMSLEDVLLEVKDLGYYENFQPQDLSQSLYTTDPEMDYHTGEDTYYGLHINADEVSMQKLNKILAEGGR